MTEEKREEMLGDLEAMDAKFEMIGSYPELVAEAKMWDGDESKFADPVAMYLERVEAMQAEGLQEQQTRKAAEEATGMFNWSSSLTGGSPAQNIDASMSGGYPKGSIIYINGREVDLSQCYAIDSSGNKLNKDDFITTPAGNINWYEFPSDEHTRQMMKKKGVKVLPVRLRVGIQQKASGAGGYGFMHVMKHYNQMVDMNPSESPLMHLFNTLTGKLSITKNGILRKTMDSANNGQARKLVIELKEDEGFYSIVSSYPVSYYPRESNGIAIKGVYLKFMPGRAASGLNESNQADSTTPESTGVTGQSLSGRIPKNAKSVNIYDLKILEKDGALVFQQKQEEKVNLASYSVTGGKNLAAVHSLSAEKFLAAVELGGMPMPSVAVTRLDRPYEWGGAGAINLIGKPEMVDPRKKSKVYMHDAYTGKMPPVMYRKKNTEGAQKLKEDALEKLAPYGMDASDGLMSGIFSNDYNESVVDGYYADWGNNRALMAYWAITQAGYAPKPKMKEAEGRLSPELYKALKPWVDTLPKGRMYSDDYTEDVLEGFRAAMVGYFEGKGKAVLADNYRGQDYRTLQLQAMDFAGMVVRKHTTKKVPDAVENGKRFVAYAEKRHKAFKAWADTERKKYLGEKVFSRKFMRRNWRGEVVDEWWGHEKYTLGNLMKYMREEKGRGEESASMSPGLFLAVVSEEFRSLREMQSKRDRIVDSYAHQDAREEWQKSWDKFNKLAYGLKKPGWGSYFEIADAALWRLLRGGAIESLE